MSDGETERPGCAVCRIRGCAVCRIRDSFNEDEYERKIPCDLLVRLILDDWIPMQYVNNTSLGISLSDLDWEVVDSLPANPEITAPLRPLSYINYSYRNVLAQFADTFREWRRAQAGPGTPLTAEVSLDNTTSGSAAATPQNTSQPRDAMLLASHDATLNGSLGASQHDTQPLDAQYFTSHAEALNASRGSQTHGQLDESILDDQFFTPHNQSLNDSTSSRRTLSGSVLGPLVTGSLNSSLSAALNRSSRSAADQSLNQPQGASPNDSQLIDPATSVFGDAAQHTIPTSPTRLSSTHRNSTRSQASSNNATLNSTAHSLNGTNRTFTRVPESELEREAMNTTIELEIQANTTLEGLFDQRNKNRIRPLSEIMSGDLGDMDFADALRTAHESLRQQTQEDPVIQLQVEDLIQQDIIRDMSLAGGDVQPQVLDGMMSQRAAVYQGFNNDFSPEAFHQWILQHGNPQFRRVLPSPNPDASFESLLSGQRVLADTFDCSQTLDGSYPELLPLDDTFERRAEAGISLNSQEYSTAAWEKISHSLRNAQTQASSNNASLNSTARSLNRTFTRAPQSGIRSDPPSHNATLNSTAHSLNGTNLSHNGTFTGAQESEVRANPPSEPLIASNPNTPLDQPANQPRPRPTSLALAPVSFIDAFNMSMNSTLGAINQSLLSNRSTDRSYTTPEAPHQNSMAERSYTTPGVLLNSRTDRSYTTPGAPHQNLMADRSYTTPGVLQNSTIDQSFTSRRVPQQSPMADHSFTSRGAPNQSSMTDRSPGSPQPIHQSFLTNTTRSTHAATHMNYNSNELNLLGNILAPNTITGSTSVRTILNTLEDSFSTSFAVFLEDVAQPVLNRTFEIMAESRRASTPVPNQPEQRTAEKGLVINISANPVFVNNSRGSRSDETESQGQLVQKITRIVGRLHNEFEKNMAVEIADRIKQAMRFYGQQ